MNFKVIILVNGFYAKKPTDFFVCDSQNEVVQFDTLLQAEQHCKIAGITDYIPIYVGAGKIQAVGVF